MLYQAISSLRARSPLAFLFGLITGLASVGVGIYIAMVWHDVHQRHENQLRYINQVLVRTSNEVFNHHQSILTLLGERLLEIDALREPERGREMFEQVLQLHPSLVAFGLALPDGQLVLVSDVPPGTPLPNLAEQNASRESFRQAVAGEGMQIGHTYYMPVLERWVIPVRTPIVDRQGRLRMVMTAGISAERSDTAWNALELPEAVEIAVLRDDGYLQYASAPRSERREEVYSHPTPPDLMQRLRSTRASGQDSLLDDVVTPLIGTRRMMVVTYMPQWKLYAITSKEQQAIYADLRQRLVVPGLLYVFFLIGALFLYRHTRHLQRRYEDRLLFQAHYDGLTGLPNRFLALDRLTQSLGFMHGKKLRLAAIILDLQRFKRINESMGRRAGDALLRQVSKRLGEGLRQEDTLARLGSDEFLILLPNMGNAQAVQQRVEELCEFLRRPFTLDGHQIHVDASIGVAIAPFDAENAEQLLQRAETALSQAKGSDRGGVHFYSRHIDRATHRQLKLEAAMRVALQDERFEMYYQPQIALGTGAVVGLEALLRWHDPELGPLSPAEFIPVAENSGLIVPLGEWVLRRACDDLSQGLAQWPELSLAVNVSYRQFRDPGLVSMISEVIESCGCPAQRLELEITESLFMEDAEENVATLRRMRELGIGIAVDDFGTGYSSLSYIQRLPITTLKIDKAFVHALHQDPQQATLTRSIITMGQSLGLGVVAEGIETVSQQVMLHEMGCEIAQGYLYSRPLPLDELRDFLRQHELRGSRHHSA